MKVVQKWECPTCGRTYEAPLPVFEVICPKDHPRSHGRQMRLVEGNPIVKRSTKKETPHGKSRSVRRA